MNEAGSVGPGMEDSEDLDLDTLTMLLEECEEEPLKEPEEPASGIASTSTLTELGLVLSDEEEEEPVASSGPVTAFGAAFSGSKLSQKQAKLEESGPTEAPDLEAELEEMQARVKQLQQTLAKKKKLKDEHSSKFTKLTATPSLEGRIASTRTLSAKEESELRLNLKRRSELHSGDTDSEDEEDNRNPMEQQYNTLGRDIRQRIAHESNNQVRTQADKTLARVKTKGVDGTPGWKQNDRALVNLSKGNAVSSPVTDKNVSQDMYSGIRIINPLVSQQSMQERMEGRRMVRMSTITLHLRNGEIEGDWVTIGVLVSKSNPKTSQKGTQYSIWKLSDLSDCTKTVALFLFGGSHKALWKNTVGTVVGILNPNIMKENSSNKGFSDMISLSIFEPQRVMVMGASKDLGWCKGRTKQNEQCRSFVNKSSCEFCVYHIQREYQKTSSKRADLQSSFNRVDPKRRLQERVLGKDQVFYGGQLYANPSASSVPKQPKANRAKDLATLNSLKTKMKAEELKAEDLKAKKSLAIPKHLSEGEATAVRQLAQRSDSLGEKLIAPTPGARNLLKHIAKEETQKKVASGEVRSVSAKELLAMTHQDVLSRRRQQEQNLKLKSSPSTARLASLSSPPAVSRLSPSSLSPGLAPQLGRGIQPGEDIDLEISPPKQTDRAKARAMALIQRKGGIQANDPNAVKNRQKAALPEFQEKVQKRLSAADVEENDASSKKPRLTEAVTSKSGRSNLGSLDFNSDKFKEMMDKKSRHSNLVDVVENEALDKYYQGLEKKEMLEEKMSSITEITTTAYVCTKCKYLSEKASDLCREENHQLKTVKAKKRFFECRNCKQRTSSLDKLPRRACPNCDHSSWHRVAMGKAKAGPKLDSEILSLRGDELSHYSSSSGKVFLNL